MKSRFPWPAAAMAAMLAATGVASAQDNVVKFGIARYTTHSRTNGISGIGVPPGADAQTGDATTLVFEYERLLSPNWGVELALGIPPKITAKATGSVAYLGEVLSARNVAPTLLVNYHFGQAGDIWRPYLGVGLNYTRFTNITTPYAWDVKLRDSVGFAAQLGVDYAYTKEWGLFASVAKVDVKSKLVATGAVVLQSTIDFRPITYSFGASYRF